MNNGGSGRTAELCRNTKETKGCATLNLDGKGSCSISTNIGFLDHMLEQLAKHSGFDLSLEMQGDIEVDVHHTVEDAGILLGKALRQCLGDSPLIERYGYAWVPMDESLCNAVVDICGRINLVFQCSFEAERVGGFDTELVEEFFKALCTNAGITLHINVPYGRNTHHKVEAIFKAVARALGEAVKMDEKITEVRSTKGCL